MWWSLGLQNPYKESKGGPFDHNFKIVLFIPNKKLKRFLKSEEKKKSYS